MDDKFDATKSDGYMPEIFDYYKTFRNSIRKYPLEDSLGVIRVYSQHLANNLSIPSDMTVFPAVKDPVAGVHQWELEIIARECIAHSPNSTVAGRTMRNHHNFLEVLYKLRKLEDQISGIVGTQDNVLIELHRIGHRQFQWQTDTPNDRLMIRYYKIFNHSLMQPLIQQKFDMDMRTIYTIGLGLAGTYLKWFALHYPPEIKLDQKYGVTHVAIDKFLVHFSSNIDDLREGISEEVKQNMNEKYAYFFDAFKSFPLIQMKAQGKDSLVAPIPTMLTWRFTQGIYYEIYEMKGFDKAFGGSFQQYIGDVLADVLGESMIILPEEKSANDRGVPCSDWFVIDEESVLYVESKTKRLQLGAKVSLNDTTALESELKKLAMAVRQTYQCIDASNNQKLKGEEYLDLSHKRPYPIVVTLESWYIFGSTWVKLNEFVKEELIKHSLPVEWLEDFPFTVCSVSEFENLIRAISVSSSIKTIFKEKLEDPKLREYELYTYLFNYHRNELRSGAELFEGEFEALFH